MSQVGLAVDALISSDETTLLREKLHARTGTVVAVLKIGPGDQPGTVTKGRGR